MALVPSTLVPVPRCCLTQLWLLLPPVVTQVVRMLFGHHQKGCTFEAQLA